MRAFINSLWTDQAAFFAALTGVGASLAAADATYNASHSIPLAVGAGLTALGAGGTATHSVGSAIRNSGGSR